MLPDPIQKHMCGPGVGQATLGEAMWVGGWCQGRDVGAAGAAGGITAVTVCTVTAVPAPRT